MNCPLGPEKLVELKSFISMCHTKPEILHHPSLEFFANFIKDLGGVLPPVPTPKPNVTEPKTEPKVNDANEPMEEDDVEEPDEVLELDMEGVIEPDVVDDSQIMADAEKEVTEEESDQSDEKRTQAMKSFANQEYDEAIKLYTEAIQLNPSSALLYSKRGQTYLKLNKPNACIQDCTRALELNCDSAPSYKFRGRAYRLLGQFDKAASDLRESCKIDFDEQAQEWLKEVTPNADKIRAHNLNVQRRKEERDHKEKAKQYARAKAAHASAAKEQAEATKNGGGAEFPGDFMKFFSDPEIADALKDPEVAAAMQDIQTNPSNILKHMNNPKIKNILMKQFGGFSGFSKPPQGEEEPKFTPPPANDNMGLD